MCERHSRFGERVAFAGGDDVGSFRDRTIGQVAVALDTAGTVCPTADRGRVENVLQKK